MPQFAAEVRIVLARLGSMARIDSVACSANAAAAVTAETGRPLDSAAFPWFNDELEHGRGVDTLEVERW